MLRASIVLSAALNVTCYIPTPVFNPGEPHEDANRVTNVEEYTTTSVFNPGFDYTPEPDADANRVTNGEEYTPTPVFNPGFHYTPESDADANRVTNVEEYIRNAIQNIVSSSDMTSGINQLTSGIEMLVHHGPNESLQSADELWGRTGGYHLFTLVNNDRLHEAIVYLVSAIALHRPLLGPDSSSFARDVVDTCRFRKNSLQKTIRTNHRHYMDYRVSVGLNGDIRRQREAIVYGTFAVDLEILCPTLFDSPEFRAIALSQRIHRSAIQRDVGLVDEYTRPLLTLLRYDVFHSFTLFSERVDGAILRLFGIDYARFVGENGVGPGVIREFFSLFANELAMSVFRPRTDEAPFYMQLVPNPYLTTESMVHIGKFLAVAIIEERSLGLDLPVTYYARMIGQRLKLEDIKEDEPQVFKLMDGLRKSQSVAEMGIEEMEINGDFVPVTMNNIDHLIEEKINNSIPQEIEGFIEAIGQGFREVIPVSLIAPADALTLKHAIRGTAVVKIDELKAAVVYDGGYTAEHDAIKIFWEIVGAFDDERRSQLIQFVTGTKYLPLGGLQGMGRKLKISKADANRMPVAQTCGMLLILPEITDKDVMTAKLNWAIDSGLEGFLLA